MQTVSYMGDGSTKEFNFNFPYFENSNIVVTVNNETAPTYSVVGTSAGQDADIPYTGGKIVFETAPSSLDCIKISRQLPLSRIVDYQPLAKIDPTTLNQDMNYMMEVLKDLQDEFDGLYSQYADIADKDSTATLLARINAVNAQIHDFETDIANGRIMSKDDFYSYATNCLTEISQDIKLELSSGTLKLKAGSKVYVPNGASVFDTIITSTDFVMTSTSDDNYMIFLKQAGGLTLRRLSTQTASGTTTPTSGYCGYYNITDNKIYQVDNGVISNQLSLPICMVTVSGGAITSIDQVFNGFGYIGNTIFALPGVKGLIPNGRNADGGLKNTSFTTSTVLIKTGNTTGTDAPLVLKANDFQNYSVANYNNVTNFNIDSTGTNIGRAIVGTWSADSNGVITSFETKLPFQMADFSDSNS